MTAGRPQEKTIVIVGSYPFEDTNAAKARIASFRKALMPLGRVIILCRRGKQPLDDEGVVTVDFPQFAPRNFLVRGLAELWFSLRLARKLRSMAPDLAIVTIPSLLLLVLAARRRLPVIFDIRDLVWDYLPEESFIQRLAKRGLAAWCLAMLRRIPTLTVTNEAERRHLRAMLGSEVVIEVLANGLSRDRFDQLSARPAARPSGARRLLYVGNVGLAQDLETLLAAARQRPDMHFTIVGTGSDLARIQRLVGEMNLHNVELTGGMGWDGLIRYYDEADVLYAQIGKQYHTAVPSKLAEYMVVGRPLIFGGVGASADWLRQFSGVAVIPPSDPSALAGALGTVGRLWEQMDVKANRGRVEASYLRDHQARIMADLARIRLATEPRNG